MIPPLHRHDNLFAERNLFLHALLGLVSCARRTKGFVLAVAAQADDPVVPATPQRKTELRPHGDSRVYLLLGVVSLWRRIDREFTTWVSQASAPAPAGQRPGSPRRRPPPGTWFR